ncbi:MAG: HEAT repeat domain-containing protein [Spirochaetes bacterium]|nr:HEAT repeat domain-containing protein [Spirochaetota bacterium]
MKKIIFYYFFFLFLVQFSLLFSESNEAKSKKKRDKIQSYISKIKQSGDKKQKIVVLDSILKEFKKINYTNEDESLVELIINLSTEGSIKKELNDNGDLINDFSEVRIKASIILGKLGGDTVRDALIDILTNDKNFKVKIEACKALGLVKDNENGDIIRAIIYTYRNSYSADIDLIFTMINTIKVIAKQKNIYSQNAIFFLNEIQLGNDNEKIRKAALKAKTQLIKEQGL